MDRGRNLFIFKVKAQISRSLGLLFGLRCSNLVCILYMDRGRSLFFSRSKVKFQGHWAFTKNSGTWILVGRISQELYSLGCSNLVCILNMERGRSLLIFKVKGHISRSLDGYLGNFIWFKSNC